MKQKTHARRNSLVAGAILGVGLLGGIAALPAFGAEQRSEFRPAAETGSTWSALVAARQYDLPVGVVLPASPPALLETSGTYVQDGALEMVAAYYYICAWEDNLASAIDNGNRRDAVTARSKLARVASLPQVGIRVHDLTTWNDNIQGRLDDSSALKADVASCTYYLEQNGR